MILRLTGLVTESREDLAGRLLDYWSVGLLGRKESWKLGSVCEVERRGLESGGQKMGSEIKCLLHQEEIYSKKRSEFSPIRDGLMRLSKVASTPSFRLHRFRR